MTEPTVLAQSVIACLNGGGTSQLASLCADSVTVFAPVVEETIDPFAARGISNLAKFVDAYRLAFPDIRFVSEGVESSESAVTVKWSAHGTFRKPLGYIRPTDQAISNRGTCVLRFTDRRITEIRLAADVYDLLLQAKALCADPAESRGSSRETNSSAMETLRRAIVGRTTAVGAPFDDATVLHASICFYASQNLDQESFELEGPGRLAALLESLRDKFGGVELSVDGGTSQGRTTTFRGRARVTRGKQRYSYMFRSGFRAAGPRIAESWVELQLPATLREVLE